MPGDEAEDSHEEAASGQQLATLERTDLAMPASRSAAPGSAKLQREQPLWDEQPQSTATSPEGGEGASSGHQAAAQSSDSRQSGELVVKPSTARTTKEIHAQRNREAQQRYRQRQRVRRLVGV
jgi:hypothetical protein